MQIKPETGGKVEPTPGPAEGEAVKPMVVEPTTETVKPTPTPEAVVKPAVTPKPGLNKAVIIAVVVIGILLVSLIGYFVFRGPVPVEKLTVANLLFASSVDENFNYIERTSSNYDRGDIITIYHKIANIIPVLLDDKYQIGFSEKHELFDPDGELVPGLTEVNSYSTTTTVTSSEEQTIPITSRVNTLALTKSGTYTYRISIVDQFDSSNQDVKEIKFDLEIPTVLLAELELPIAINNLTLASSIDDNYNYVAMESSEYSFGDTIWIYHKVISIKAAETVEGYKIGIFDSVELLDPDGEEVPWAYEDNSVLTSRQVDAAGYYTIKIKSEIDSSRLNKTGTYTYIVRAVNTEVIDIPVAQEQITFIIK